MARSVEDLLDWVLERSSTPTRSLAPSGLWVGGSGVFPELVTPWTLVPSAALDTVSGWKAGVGESHDGHGDNETQG